MERIIFRNNDNSIGIIHPAQEALDIYGIEAIAIKDTPQGLPFWIVSVDEIPIDRTDRNLWEFETSKEPDGYGNQSNLFEEV